MSDYVELKQSPFQRVYSAFLRDGKFFAPWVVHASTNWDQHGVYQSQEDTFGGVLPTMAAPPTASSLRGGLPKLALLDKETTTVSI